MRVSHRAMAVAGDVGSGEQGALGGALASSQVPAAWGTVRGGAGGRAPGGCSLRACRLHEWARRQPGCHLCPLSCRSCLLLFPPQGLVKAPVWWPMKDNPGTTTASTAKNAP